MKDSVSVVIACTGSPGLCATLRSVAEQTLTGVDAWVIADAGEKELDAARKEFDRSATPVTFLEGDDKVALANEAIAQLKGDSLLVCEAGDIYYPDALEALYSRLKNRHADIAVGIGEEESMQQPHQRFMLGDFDFRESDCFERKEYNGVFLYDVQQGRYSRVDKYESSLYRVQPIMNRLFSTAVVRACGARLVGFDRAGLWAFGAEALLSAQNVTGGLYQVGRVRRSQVVGSVRTPSFEQRDAELERSAEAFAHVLEVCSRGLEAALAAEQDATECSRLRHLIEYMPAQIRMWQSLYYLDRFFRRLWLLSESGRSMLESELAKSLSGTFSSDIVKIDRTNPDCSEVIANPARAVELATPSITFVLRPGMLSGLASKQLAYLFAQDFPFFEVLAPKALEHALRDYARFANVRFVSYDDVAVYRAESLAMARGAFICFIEDALFWPDFSVQWVWQRFEWERRADVVCAMPASRPNAPYLRIARLAYDESRCGLGRKSRWNILDNSLNNKVFRISALQKKGFAFTDDSVKDVAAMFDGLLFRKLYDACIISEEGNGFYYDRVPQQRATEYKLRYSLGRIQEGVLFDKIEDRKRAKKAEQGDYVVKDSEVKDQILIYSNRGSLDALPPNLERVDKMLDGEKVYLIEPTPHSAEVREKIQTELRRSRVIVTDEYLHDLPGIELSDKQSVIQLWHAAGAFKKFGLDCFGMSSNAEKRIHRQYRAVMVSAEGVREIYAGAFGIPVDKVLALGSPRTDELLDEQACRQRVDRMHEKYPWMEKQTFILYSPTFRQKLKACVAWDTGLDWEHLDSQLAAANAHLVLKPHPLDPTVFDFESFGNVDLIADEDINDLVAACDLLVTDYSSVIFDASLLDKKMLFYCPDFDEYERDFYLEFPEDLPGDVVYAAGDFWDAVQKTLAQEADSRMETFRERFMGACDGHSTERIVEYIKGLME